MKPRPAILALAAATGALAALPAVAKTPTAAHRHAPARMLVDAQEWSLWPSRSSLPAGRVVVQLWNRGQDAHDLRIRRLRRGLMSGRAQGVRVTQSGRLSQATWQLAKGSYELYCSMPGHLQRGMHARLTVR